MLSFEHARSFGLRITTQSSLNSRLTLRGYTREGMFSFTHSTQSTKLPVTENFRIPDFPIMISATDTNGFFSEGELYVQLALTIDGEVVYELFAGTVYEGKFLSWPDNGGKSPRATSGNITSTTSTDPAAGAEPVLTVPAGVVWELISLNVTLVTAATAANRRVHFAITDGFGGSVNCFSSIDQTASTTRLYSGANFGHLPDEADDNDIVINVPPNLLLIEGGDISTETTNLQAGDNFTALRATFKEYYADPL